MNKKEKKFVSTVRDFYKAHGRHTLPWRKTRDPYRILVSEIMLQQTQVERVVPKYIAFTKRWPKVTDLANASLGEVLCQWQGLGYNRRARLLHECARAVAKEHKGAFPKTYRELQTLPGVGPYTAGAVMAFAYNKPVPVLETNIRTVYIYHFFKHKSKVSEAALLEKVTKTLPTENVREWYAALMDYGSYLKREAGNLNRQARAYQKQSKFKGSDRQIRGAIVRVLSDTSETLRGLKKKITAPEEKLKQQLQKLIAEGLVVKNGHRYALPR